MSSGSQHFSVLCICTGIPPPLFHTVMVLLSASIFTLSVSMVCLQDKSACALKRGTALLRKRGEHTDEPDTGHSRKTSVAPARSLAVGAYYAGQGLCPKSRKQLGHSTLLSAPEMWRSASRGRVQAAKHRGTLSRCLLSAALTRISSKILYRPGT